MYSNEHTLQDLLKQAFHRLDMDDTANEIDVKYAYRQVAGNLINQLTWSIQFKDGVLRLGIASPALCILRMPHHLSSSRFQEWLQL